MADKKYLSKIVKGTDTLYLKDSEAQQAIEELQSAVTGAMHYLGTSTTALSDGLEMVDSGAGDGQAVSVTIDGITYRKAAPDASDDWTQLKSGDVAVYTVDGKDMEFVYNDATNKWREYGSTGSLKALAFKDNASGNFTPAGTNADSAVSFSGQTSGTFVTGYNSDGVDASFTEGAFSAGTLPSFTEGEFSQGTLPSKEADTFNAGTLPSLGSATTSAFATEGETSTYDENTETLTFSAASTSDAVTAQGTFSQGTLPSFTEGAFSAGTLPSKAADTFNAGTLPSKDADSFSAGTAATLATASAVTAVGTGTAAAQTFSGTQGSVTVS